MAKREILGRVDCPECGMSGAEVKRQKNGLAYRWCPECNAQYFTRTAETSARLLEKCGAPAVPVPVTVSEEVEAENEPVPVPAPAPAPAPAPKKRGTGNALLDLIQGAA